MTGRRFRIEAGLAAASALLLAVTLVWPAWIELLTGFDPDRSSGALELGLVLALAVCTVTFSALARHEWRGHRTA